MRLRVHACARNCHAPVFKHETLLAPGKPLIPEGKTHSKTVGLVKKTARICTKEPQNKSLSSSFLSSRSCIPQVFI